MVVPSIAMQYEYYSFFFPQFNDSKYCNVSQTIQLNISHLFTQLNSEIVLFLAIQLNISHLFARS